MNKEGKDIQVLPIDFNIKPQVRLIDLDKTMKDNQSVQLMNEELFYRAINR